MVGATERVRPGEERRPGIADAADCVGSQRVRGSVSRVAFTSGAGLGR